MNNKIILISLGVIVLALYSFSNHYQDPWVVPKEYQDMKNPTDKADRENMAIGKALYSKHCKSCHGKEGYGDGPKAADMSGDLGDFSSPEFQAQSDGALFYKTTVGRDDMPAFDKKMPDEEDRWLVVNYMRTLKE